MKLGLQVKYISINSKKDVEELLNLIQLLFKQNTNKEILLIDQLQPIITRGLNKTIRLLKTKKRADSTEAIMVVTHGSM